MHDSHHRPMQGRWQQEIWVLGLTACLPAIWAVSQCPEAEAQSQRWSDGPSALGILASMSAEVMGQHPGWDHHLILVLPGSRCPGGREGALQLTAKESFENAAILRACNGLIDPLPSEGKYLEESVLLCSRHPVSMIGMLLMCVQLDLVYVCKVWRWAPHYLPGRNTAGSHLWLLIWHFIPSKLL